MRKRVLAFLVALLTATGIGLVVDAPAAHAASCWRSGCNGLDPYTEGCWTSDVWVSPPSDTGPAGQQVRLVYSPECNANWAVFSGEEVDSAYVEDVDGDVGDDIINEAGGYTQMVDGGVAARGVIHVATCCWLRTLWY